MGEAATGNLYRVQNPIKVCKLQRPNEFKPPYMPKESRFVGGWLHQGRLRFKRNLPFVKTLQV